MRRDLTIEQLGDFVDLPLLAILATYRRDGSVLLSPVWHEWRDGGFLILTGADDIKTRHLRNDPRAVVVVAENEAPYRGVEVSGMVSLDMDQARVIEAFRRIAVRYLGPEQGVKFANESSDDMALVHLVPGRLRTWDFADDPLLGG